MIIDGCKGQLHAVEQVLMEMGLTEILLLAEAKGVTRKPGKEIIYVADRASSVKLQPTSAALHLIQHLRDEVHRFSISDHRAQRYAETDSLLSINMIYLQHVFKVKYA